jgi:hypothetical protein
MRATALLVRQVGLEQRAFWRSPEAAFFTFALPIGLLVIFASRRATGWPGEADVSWVVLVLLIISLIPVALALLDFFAERKAILGSQWFNIDLSRGGLVLKAAAETEVLPANLGVTGPVVSDTAPMDIMKALSKATQRTCVVVDIQEGDAWWVTRLIAFSAGAVRRGAPEVIVFVGRRASHPDQFLGWATPSAVLEAILQDRDVYRERYEKAVVLARHLTFFRGTQFLPQGVSLHPEVIRYIAPMLSRIQTRGRRQVLLSTQSIELLRDPGIGLNEVFLLIPSVEGTEIKPAAAFEEIAALLEGGMSIGEAVMPRTRPQRAEQLSIFPDG